MMFGCSPPSARSGSSPPCAPRRRPGRRPGGEPRRLGHDRPPRHRRARPRGPGPARARRRGRPRRTRRPTDEPGFDAKRGWAGAEKAGDRPGGARRPSSPGRPSRSPPAPPRYLLAELIASDSGSPAHGRDQRPARSPTSCTAPRGVEVILTGGVRTPSDALVGPVADATLASLRVDRTYLGVHGLDAAGLTTPNLAEAATDRALMACAAATTVLADHTKWGVVGLARIAPLDDVDTLLTDDALPADARRHLTDDHPGHGRHPLEPPRERPPAPRPRSPTAGSCSTSTTPSPTSPARRPARLDDPRPLPDRFAPGRPTRTASRSRSPAPSCAATR